MRYETERNKLRKSWQLVDDLEGKVKNIDYTIEKVNQVNKVSKILFLESAWINIIGIFFTN